MRENIPGFTIPEERFNPQPFYYDMPPPIYRWNQWRGNNKWDAFQRWFYTCFCGRTMESVWYTECAAQASIDIKNYGDYTDPLNWNLPSFEHPAAGAEYLGQPNAYSNFMHLEWNARPANPKTGVLGQTAADAFYMATRHSYPRCAFRIAMKLPSAANLATQHTDHHTAGDTYMGLGFEVNSQGQECIAVFELYESGAALGYRLRYYQPGYNSTTADQMTNYQNPYAAITINNPDVWCWYYMEYDPPVLRFVQPIAGQTDPFVAGQAAMTEITVPNTSASALMQPMIFNESNVWTGTDLLTGWYVGQWAIWPLHNSGTRYEVYSRTNIDPLCCTPWYVIWDSGGADQILVYMGTIGCGCTYTIEWSDEGQDQPANMPETRVWRRIDDSDYTGVTDVPTGIASKGLFGAARFYRVTITESTNSHSSTGTEYVAFTGNKAGRG